MFATDSVGVDSLLLGCPPKPPLTGVGDPRGLPSQFRLVVLLSHIGSAEVGLRMELPWRTPARLAVYDLVGRRVMTLLDREVPAGVTDVKWNGIEERGGHVASGMYFARLTCAKGARVSKIIMLR